MNLRGEGSLNRGLVLISSEQGSSMILFFAIALPVIILALTFVTDVSYIISDQKLKQSYADSAVALGAKGLPYPGQAAYSARMYMQASEPSLRPGAPNPSTLSYSSDRNKVEVSVQVRSQPLLAGLMGENAAFNYSVRSIAKVSPRDALIFVDNSNLMAPSLRTGGVDNTTFWGKRLGVRFIATDQIDESPDWIPATFFQNLSVLSRTKSINIQNVYSQQCFSPALSAEKLAAIRLYDYIANNPLNSVGVIAGPSVTGDIFTIKPINQAGFNSPFSSEGALENALDAHDYIVRDQDCLAAAERASAEAASMLRPDLVQYERTRMQYDWFDWSLPNAESRHGFPHYSPDLDSSLVYQSGRPDSFRFTDDDGNLISENMHYLSAREAIWSRVINRSRVVDLGTILDSIKLQMDRAPLRAEERGDLTDGTTSAAYIFLGDLPHMREITGGDLRFNDWTSDNFATFEQKMTELNIDFINRNRKLFLYVIIIWHEGMIAPNLCNNCDVYHNYADQFAELDNYLERLDNMVSHVQIQAIRTPNLGALSASLPSYLAHVDKSTVISAGAQD